MAMFFFFFLLLLLTDSSYCWISMRNELLTAMPSPPTPCPRGS